MVLGISVVLDLTPNYRGASPWFGSGNSADVMEKVKVRKARNSPTLFKIVHQSCIKRKKSLRFSL